MYPLVPEGFRAYPWHALSLLAAWPTCRGGGHPAAAARRSLAGRVAPARRVAPLRPRTRRPCPPNKSAPAPPSSLSLASSRRLRVSLPLRGDPAPLHLRRLRSGGRPRAAADERVGDGRSRPCRLLPRTPPRRPLRPLPLPFLYPAPPLFRSRPASPPLPFRRARKLTGTAPTTCSSTPPSGTSSILTAAAVARPTTTRPVCRHRPRQCGPWCRPTAPPPGPSGCSPRGRSAPAPAAARCRRRSTSCQREAPTTFPTATRRWTPTSACLPRSTPAAAATSSTSTSTKTRKDADAGLRGRRERQLSTTSVQHGNTSTSLADAGLRGRREPRVASAHAPPPDLTGGRCHCSVWTNRFCCWPSGSTVDLMHHLLPACRSCAPV